MATTLPGRARGLSALFLVLALTAIGVRTHLQSDASRPSGWTTGPSTVVYIKPKTGVQEIAHILRDAGVIQSRWAFLALAYIQGSLTRLHAGEYEFTRDMPLREILQKLESGRVITHQVTIPEGFTSRDIARLLVSERLAEAGHHHPDDFFLSHPAP